MGVAGDMINDGTEEIISQMDKAKNITITIWGECGPTIGITLMVRMSTHKIKWKHHPQRSPQPPTPDH